MSFQRCPKIIWTLWLQGWDQAPAMVLSCLESWKRLNVGWQVNALTRETLRDFLPAETIEAIAQTPSNELEAMSDRIRIELLARYGGVWADATTVCAKPLDEWLDANMLRGFFAFDKPTADRALATWFLAAEKGNYVINEWRRRTRSFWFGRKTHGGDYFWFHRLFAEAHASDPEFRRLWEATPRIPAMHLFHFGPNDGRLMGPLESKYIEALKDSPAVVFKLSYKQSAPIQAGSVAEFLCLYARGLHENAPAPQGEPYHRRRILLTWYGSFAGHGTIGDLRSMESVATHLHARGHQVLHATADPECVIPGTQRVQWEHISHDQFDLGIFVCGPILSFHPLTNALFDWFGAKPLIGVGVSLLARDDAGYANPFSAVLARQGRDTDYADVAIVAPPPEEPPRTSTSTQIGVSLRGHQTEYGEERCRADDVATLSAAAIDEALSKFGGVATTIENHLTRAGLSPDGIEVMYLDCDLILTSRFHGAITALRHGVPFIAIDQIAGGAKVFDLLAPLGWKHVYRIDELEQRALTECVTELLQRTDRAELHQARANAIQGANRTLFELDRVIASTAMPASDFAN